MNEERASVTESGISAVPDLDLAEIEVMKLRAEVMIRTAQCIKDQGWTQVEAARRLGISQPRVSRLIKGKVKDFSLDMLLTLAARAGLRLELQPTSVNSRSTDK
jgi:predicted XRE-type DNA-binding protein